MQRRGGIVGVEEVGAVIEISAMRALDHLECIWFGDRLKTDPGVRPMHSMPGKIGCVLMPWGAPAPAVPFQKDLFGEVPDAGRAPEIGEQFAKRDRRNQLVKALGGGRVRVLVVRFFFPFLQKVRRQTDRGSRRTSRTLRGIWRVARR
jgi:hypothetical protein